LQNNSRNFEEWEQILRKLTGVSDQTNWKIYQVFEDELGQVHYKIKQYYNGVELKTGMGIIHTSKNKILSINGEFIPENLLKGTFQLSVDKARTNALEHIKAQKYY